MIRQAQPMDAPSLAKFISMAMGSLPSKFTGDSDPSKAIALFERFASLPSNPYSYENTLVYEDGTGVCGAITAYDGANLEILRAPFLAYIRSTYGLILQPEAETQSGEYYIDCIGVSAERQGKGIGKKLIHALIEKAGTLNHPKVGLIVHQDNPQAEKLYANLGFNIVNKKYFMQEEYVHMQYDVPLPSINSNLFIANK